MTKNDQRDLARALAFAPIEGTSIELEPVDRKNIRENIAIHLAEQLGFDGDTFLAQVEATRMMP